MIGRYVRWQTVPQLAAAQTALSRKQLVQGCCCRHGA